MRIIVASAVATTALLLTSCSASPSGPSEEDKAAFIVEIDRAGYGDADVGKQLEMGLEVCEDTAKSGKTVRDYAGGIAAGLDDDIRDWYIVIASAAALHLCPDIA